MQAGTPGRSLSPASPPGWTQGTPFLAVGLSAQCCVTPPGSCHLHPGVAGLHGSSVASRRWHHGLGGVSSAETCSSPGFICSVLCPLGGRC